MTPNIKVKKEPGIREFTGNEKNQISKKLNNSKNEKFLKSPIKNNKNLNNDENLVSKCNDKIKNCSSSRRNSKSSSESSFSSSAIKIKGIESKSRKNNNRKDDDKDKDREGENEINDFVKQYMIDVPDLKNLRNSQDNDKFSSPLKVKIESDKTVNLLKLKMGIEETNEELSELDLNCDSNNSFLSSPCIDRKINEKRNRSNNSIYQDNFKKLKINKDTEMANESQDNSFDSIEAMNGSDEIFDDKYLKKLETPKKYIVDKIPVFEYMEGEDEFYNKVMGKTTINEEFDENEKQFLNFVHMNFEQWSEQHIKFTKEYDNLMKKVILARKKFDKRVQFLKKHIDSFALDLEKHGDKINERSKILKDYCNKIVEEID